MSSNYNSNDFSFKSFNSVQNNEMSIKSSGQSKSSSQGRPSPRTRVYNDNNKVFVGALNHQTEEKVFKEYFAKYGNLEDSVVIKDSQTGKSRGFGFVKYTDAESVDKLMKERPHTLDQHVLDLKRSIPRTETPTEESKAKITKLYVGGLIESLDENDLRSHFSQFGNVLSVEIPRAKETNKTRGFAFVNFDDYDAVDKIVLAKRNIIKGIRLRVRKAFPRDKFLSNQQRENKGNVAHQMNSTNNLESIKKNFQSWMFQRNPINSNSKFNYDDEYPGGLVVPAGRSSDPGYSVNQIIPNYHLEKHNYEGPIRNKKWDQIKQSPYHRPSSY